MITCGMSLTYLIGAFVNWRTLALIGNILLSGVLFTKQNQVFDVILILFVSISGIVPCLIQLLSLPFIPDSPRWLVSCPWYDCLGLYVLDMAYPSGWRFFIIIFVWVKTCHQVVLVIFCRQRSAAWRRVILHYSALEEKILMFTKRPMKSEYVFRMHSCVAKGRSQMDKCISSDELYFYLKDYTEALQQQTEASIIGLFQLQYLKSLTVSFLNFVLFMDHILGFFVCRFLWYLPTAFR